MKYKITEESIEFEGHTLYRIEDLEGIKGGFVEGEHNLSQEGKCWIHNNAKVFGNAAIRGDAKIYDSVIVKGEAQILDRAKLNHKVVVSGMGIVSRDARLYGKVQIQDGAYVSDNAVLRQEVIIKDSGGVYEDALVDGNCVISDYAIIKGRAVITENARISGHATIKDHGRVKGDAWVSGQATICGNTLLYGEAKVYGEAVLKYGSMNKDMYEDMKNYILCSLNALPIKGYYYLFKRVNIITDGFYRSLYDMSFNYEDGKIAVVKYPNEDKRVSCGSGLHVSNPTYWNQGDTTIGVKVHIDDVIACQQGKLRVRKLEVIGEVA